MNSHSSSTSSTSSPSSSSSSSLYQVLGLDTTRRITVSDITSAYKRLTRIHHPDKQHDESKKKEATELFSQLQDAYEILHNHATRLIYNSFGYEGIKVLRNERILYSQQQTIDEANEEMKREQNSHGQKKFIYDDDEDDDEDDINVKAGRPRKRQKQQHQLNETSKTKESAKIEPKDYLPPVSFWHAFAKEHNIDSIVMQKPDDIRIILPLKLEDFTRRTKKTLTITRKRFDANYKLKDVSKVIPINVEHNWVTGHLITFSGQGSQIVLGGPPGDVVLEVQEMKHDLYVRDPINPYDLIHTKAISLVDALCGVRCMIRAVDGIVITPDTKNVTEIIRPGFEMTIEGRGMLSNVTYNLNNEEIDRQYGNVKIKFEIQFPQQSLTIDQKQILKALNIK